MMTQGPIDLTIGPMGNYRLHQVSTFYTKVALDLVGRYVADYYNYVFDRELLYRIINRFSVYLDNRALGAFRIHQNSKSNSKIIPFSIEFARLYRNKKDGNVKHDKMREERAKNNLYKGKIKMAKTQTSNIGKIFYLIFALYHRPFSIFETNYWAYWKRALKT